MKEDAKTQVLEAMLRITEAMKAAADAVNADQPLDAVTALIAVSDGCERLAGAMVRIEAEDTGKRVEELCNCQDCERVLQEAKDKNEAKTASPFN